MLKRAYRLTVRTALLIILLLNASVSAEQLPEYTIRALFPGHTPHHLDEVLASVEAQLRDTLNVKLDFQFVPTAEYRSKILMMMAAGDDFDLHLNAQWLSIYTMIADESIQAWDELLAQHGPHVLRSIPKPMLDANTFYGKMYGIPNGNVYGKVLGWGLRKDLREKYGMSKLTTLEEFERFLMHVKAQEPDMIPISWQGAVFSPLEATLPLEIQGREIKFGAVEFRIYVHADGTIEPVLGVFDDPYSMKAIRMFRRWHLSGLIDPHVMTQQDANGAFQAGHVAAVWQGATEIHTAQALTASLVPGAEVEFLKVGWGEQKLTTDFQMWNFLVLNSKSRDPVRVTQFIDWIFADRANYDLLAHGIEGIHWVDTGNGTFAIPDKVSAAANYNFPGYVLLWKPDFERVLADASEEQLAWVTFLRDVRNMTPSTLLGFNPDLSDLKTEFAKCHAIWSTVVQPIRNGLVDPDAEIPNARKVLTAAGYDTILEELNRQLEDFKASKKE